MASAAAAANAPGLCVLFAADFETPEAKRPLTRGRDVFFFFFEELFEGAIAREE